MIETFERFGTKSNWVARQLKTILLKDVTKDESIITDHIWFTCGKTFENIDLTEGDIIQFDECVTTYNRGLRDKRTIDYKSSNPTKAIKMTSI